MAKRVARLAEVPQYRCRDCQHSYDWHEKNWRGELFMCRCKHHHDGKFTKFLKDPQCEHFTLRKNG
nr:MAG TPA: zinc-ribbon domain protein [Caudoviricetes sp.]